MKYILQGIILALSLKGLDINQGEIEITTRHSPFFLQCIRMIHGNERFFTRMVMDRIP